MIRTPTPTRDKCAPKVQYDHPPNKLEQEVQMTRTRNKSREVAKELQTSYNVKQLKENKPTKSHQNLVKDLGLDISSSSADESSPVKRKIQQRKRKRPSLGFSDSTTGAEQQILSTHSAKKRIVTAK